MMQANLSHPGRASHISQSWSSFALPTADRAPTSPMAALNCSRTQSITSYPQTPTSPPAAAFSNASASSLSSQPRQPAQSASAFSFPSYASTSPPEPSPAADSPSATASPILLLSANDSNALINASMNEVDSVVASKVHILPPSCPSSPPSPDKPLSSSPGRTKSQGATEFTI